MSAQQPQRQRTILTDDGELRDANERETALATIYCANCGSPSPMDARFCRSCGQSLDDRAPVAPQRYTPPEQKSKHDELHRARALGLRPAPQVTVLSVLFNLFKLIIAGGIFLTLSENSNWAMALAFLIAWIIVEAIQNNGIR